MLWQRSRGDEWFVLATNVGWVNELAFSPRGDLLAGWSEDDSLRVWDMASRQERFAISGASGLGGFSRDGEALAYGTRDGSVRLCAAATGRELHSIANAGHIVALLNDGVRVATTSTNFAVAIWDFADGNQLQVVPGVGGPNRDREIFGLAVAITLDGTRLAVVNPTDDPDHQITLWDVPSRTPWRDLPFQAPVHHLRFSPDGRKLVAIGPRVGERLWDLEAGADVQLQLGGHEAAVVFEATFSPGAPLLATGCDNETIRLWHTASGQLYSSLRGHENAVWALAFSHDGKRLASGGLDGTVRMWAVEGTRVPETLTGLSPSGAATEWQSLAWSPDSRWLASGRTNGTVEVWDAATLEPRAELPDTIHALGFSQDGAAVLTWLSEGALAWWQLETGNLANLIPAPLPVAAPPRVTVSPDGRYLASATLPGPIDLFDLAAGTRVPLVGHAKDVGALAFSRDGRTLVSGDWRGAIRQWDVPERRSVVVLADPTAVVGSGVTAAAISPDGKTLATGGADRSLTLWDLETRRPRQLPPGHRGPVWTLAFSPDGRTLASGANDRTVRLWSVPLRREVATLSWFGEDSGRAVTLVAFSPDGNNLAVLTRDGRLTVLRAATFEQTDGGQP